MYHGKHEAPKSAARHSFKKTGVLLAALVLIVSLTVGGTLAYLATGTDAVENVFTPSKVTIDIEEKFDGYEKKDVGVTNTGDIPAYARLMLTETWVKLGENGSRTPVAKPEGAKVICTPTAPEKWLQSDAGIWYYTEILAPGASATLFSHIKYEAPEGYAVDVRLLGEGIQAEPAEAVWTAWPVAVAEDGSLQLK